LREFFPCSLGADEKNQPLRGLQEPVGAFRAGRLRTR
jgi:hypothetical protein